MHRSQGFPQSLRKRRRDECEGTLRTGNVEVSLCQETSVHKLARLARLARPCHSLAW